MPGNEPIFNPIQTERISTVIVDQIRGAIADGSLQVGDRLPYERELAEQFGVSRATVRDALRVLEAMGLAEIRVGASGGTFVTSPSPDFVEEGLANMMMLSAIPPDDIAEVRLMLELSTVTLAAFRATDGDIETLRALTEKAAIGLEAGDFDPQLSREFHTELAQASHNAAVGLLARSFRGPLAMASVRAREEDEQAAHEQTIREHIAITDAIAEGDAALARQILAEHLTRATELKDRDKQLLAAWSQV